MAQSKSQNLVTLILVFFFFLEGLIAKSFIFVRNDPTVFHYTLSAIIILFLGLILSYLRGLIYIANFTLFFVFSAIAWATIATFFVGDTQNVLALVTLTLLIFGCYYIVPIISYVCDIDMARVMYFSLLIFSVISVVLFFLAPDLTTDPDSGRFSGSLISVAVACNVFFYFSVFSTFYMLSANKSNIKIVYVMLALVGLMLLYMTKTRSSLAEAVACIGILSFGFRLQKMANKRSWLSPTIILILALFFTASLSLGIFNIQSQLDDFRLVDQSIDQSRGGNWEFGIERIINAPLFGEGMLTKQTQGGFNTIDIQSGDNYDPLYDPHSLLLSFAVQAGIPFAIGMVGLIVASLGYFVRTFGLRSALASPSFVLCAVHTLVMIPAGGDLTSFGNSIDRIYWVLLGWAVVQAYAYNQQGARSVMQTRAATRPRLITSGGNIANRPSGTHVGDSHGWPA
jgi:O-Antigen ligase